MGRDQYPQGAALLPTGDLGGAAGGHSLGCRPATWWLAGYHFLGPYPRLYVAISHPRPAFGGQHARAQLSSAWEYLVLQVSSCLCDARHLSVAGIDTRQPAPPPGQSIWEATRKDSDQCWTRGFGGRAGCGRRRAAVCRPDTSNWQPGFGTGRWKLMEGHEAAEDHWAGIEVVQYHLMPIFDSNCGDSA